MTIMIYHNPKCGTLRNVLAMIRASGEEPVVIEYLKNPPTRERLKTLITAMGMPARALLREKGEALRRAGPWRSQVVGRPALRFHDRAPDPRQPADRRHA